MIEVKQIILNKEEPRQLKNSLTIPQTKRNNNLSKSFELKCPECGSFNINKDYVTNEFLCECGCVVDENIIDFGPEWRNFANSDKDNSRVGRPKSVDIHDGGLGTDFSWRDRNVSNENRMTMMRLEKWNKRSRINGNHQRHLATAFNRLRYMISNLSLPLDVQKTAAIYYRKVFELKLVHGRSIDVMVASCIYVACQVAKISRTFIEIEKVSGVKANTIANNSKLIRRKLKIKFTPTAPTQYIPRFVSNLGLSKEVEVKSLEIISKIKPNTVSAKPSVVAASTIYLVCFKSSLKVTQSDVSKATNVSATTIRKWYKIIDENLDSC